MDSPIFINDLWLCGKYIELSENGTSWEFQGIFDSKEAAIRACRDRKYFVGGPFKLNEELPDETTLMTSCFYPRAV